MKLLQFKQNFRLGVKISLGFGIMLVLLAIIGIIAALSLNWVGDRMQSIATADGKVLVVMDIQNHFQATESGMRGYLAYGDEKSAKQVENAISETIVLQYKLMELVTEDKKADVQKLTNLSAKYGDILLNDLRPVISQYNRELLGGNTAGALELKNEAHRIAQKAQVISQEMSELLKGMAKESQEVAEADLASAKSAIYLVFMITSVIGIVALLIGAVMSIRLTREIVNPVREVLAGANRCAAGDLTTALQAKSNDELGDLALAFNKMQQSLRLMIDEILKSGQEVKQSSDRLLEIADRSVQSSQQVEKFIANVAQDAGKQLDFVHDTSSVSEQMSASIQQVSASVEVVVLSAEKTAAAANDGGSTIQVAVRQMENIEKTVNNSAQVVIKLGAHSQEIGQFVETISGIASQTNLLALNAAIEAARAGEQGRGFAVVAEEVRKLAEESQKSAKQIAVLVDAIQGETKQAVVAMSAGTKEVQLGTEAVSSAGTAFNNITELVNGVSEQIREISVAIREMASGSQKIFDAIQEFDHISKELAAQTQTATAITQEQAAEINELATCSQNLSEMADNLKTSAANFCV